MLFKKRDKKIHAVVFDIGSASVGGAIMEFSSDKKIAPEILYVYLAPIAYHAHLRPDRLMKEMLETLDSVANNVFKKGVLKLNAEKFKIKNIMCVFASPWYAAETKILKIKKEETFTVSVNLVKKIIKRADKQFLKSNSLYIGGIGRDGARIIEKKAIQVFLNGYQTENPFGKKAKKADIILYISMAGKELCQKTRETIRRAFAADDISFHSFTLASFSALRDIFKNEKDFLMIDVSGELTDISTVSGGALLESASFPLGKNFLLRSVTRTLETIPEEAHSLIRARIEKKSDDSGSSKFEKAVVQAKEKWLNSFRKALSDLSEGLQLPRTIFLTADADLGAWFADAIQKDSFGKYTLAEAPFTVVQIKEKQFEGYIRISKDATKDPFLAIEGVFFHNILHN